MTQLPEQSLQQLNKFVHLANTPPPVGAVLDGMLPLLTSFTQSPDQANELIGALYTMERNTFLWLHQMSVSDKSKFEFWIKIPSLITKRMNSCLFAATSSTSGCRTLLNTISNSDTIIMDALLRAWESESKHLNSLSAISSEVSREFYGPLPRIVLPWGSQLREG